MPRRWFNPTYAFTPLERRRLACTVRLTARLSFGAPGLGLAEGTLSQGSKKAVSLAEACEGQAGRLRSQGGAPTSGERRRAKALGFIFSGGWLIGLVLGAPPLLAEDSPTYLPQVVVQSGQNSASGDVPAVPAAQRYDEVALGIAHERTVDEVLRGEPGVAVTKGGAHGAGLLYLRGIGGQGLVTLDGMPVPDTLPGVFNLNSLLPDGLQSVEVSRGYGPASRPFSSLGGAVRLASREAHDNRADLRVEGGSFGFLKETLRGDLAGKSARLAVTANRSDAFDGAYHAQKDNDNPERDPFHGTQALMRAGLDFSDALAWDGSLFYRDAWHALDGFGIRQGRVAPADAVASSFFEESWMAQNRLTARLSADWQSLVQLGYTHHRNHSRFMGLSPGYTADLYLARWESDQRLWRGESQDALHVVWGAEGRYENAHGPAFALVGPGALTAGPTLSEERSQQAGFLETRFRYGQLSGDVGVRYEGYSRFQNHALFHAGAAWQFLPQWTLHGSGGNGFRIPSYAERLYPLLGNLNIKPERSTGGDVGLEWRPTRGFKLDMTGFYNRYDDLILVSWSPAPSAHIPCLGQCLSNVPNAAIAGLETSAEIDFNENWRGGAAYTYTDSRDLDTQRRLPFRPKNSARLWGEWLPPTLPLTVWAEGIYRGLNWHDAGNTVKSTDSVRLNAQANYQLTPKLDVYVRGENLGNDKTPDFFGLDYPGAAVYGGVVWKL